MEVMVGWYPVSSKVFQITPSTSYVPTHEFRSFDECAFGPEVSSNIRSKKWAVPTNIQKAIIPIIRLKRNCKEWFGNSSYSLVMHWIF